MIVSEFLLFVLFYYYLLFSLDCVHKSCNVLNEYVNHDTASVRINKSDF